MDSEISVYRHHEDFQRISIPQLYGTLTCAILGTQVRGTLLLYLSPSSVTLRRAQRGGKGTMGIIGRAAIQLLSNINDHDALNRDERLDIVMVVPPGGCSARQEGHNAT